MRNLKKIFKSLLDFICGKREITFYFQTVRFSDALLALWYGFAELIRLSLVRNGREDFLKEVNKMFAFQGAYLFGSARSGLYSLLKALAFEDGAEVIVTGFTCDVVPNAVIQAGCKPVYADIDQETFCMSPSSAAKRITEKTRAIIIQHSFGIPADIDALIKLADEHSLYVIEDCAVSLGSCYKGQLTGTFGDAAIFSFELSKTITSCRGGLLLINSNKLQGLNKLSVFYEITVPEPDRWFTAQALIQLGISGILYHPRILSLGKYFIATFFQTSLFKKSTCSMEKRAKMSADYLRRLSNQQAVLLKRQWGYLDHIIGLSRKSTHFYTEKLQNRVSQGFLEIIKQQQINLVRFPILVPDRDKINRAFHDLQIELGMWFTAPISSELTDQELFGYTKGTCIVAENVAKKIVNLPVHMKLEDGDRIKIAEILEQQL